MANIKKIDNKSGTSYQITVSAGRDTKGKQIRHYMTWVPPKGMTPGKVEKELQRQALKFEEQVNAGTHQDNSIPFQSFAEKWLLEFAEKQLKIKTVEEYRKLLERVYTAIGHIKLKDLRTGHLNSFYSNLQEKGIKANSQKAQAKGRLNELLKEKRLSHSAFSKTANTSSSAVDAACKGELVSMKTAEKIAIALNVNYSDIFTSVKGPDVLSPTTVRAYHRVISSILSKAVKWGYIPYNPALNAELPKMKTSEAAHLDEADARQLLSLLHDEPIKYRAMITFDLLSGLRRGELLGLRWSNVDFDNETITISQTSAYVASLGMYSDKPKNKTSNRPLKLSRSAFLMLREYKDWQEKQQESCGDYWKNKDNRVFTGDDGTPIHPDALTKWFSAFIKRSGLPKTTIHSLRHTYASLMIADGTPLVVVAKRLGHAQVSTTANIYAHVIASADEKAAQVAEKFSDVVAKPNHEQHKKAN